MIYARIRSLAFLFLWLIPSLRTYGQEDLKFEHLTTAQGLSQNSVWSICQDREGFMWFGTQDGLNKYDGYTFTILKPDPRDPTHTLHHNIISDIYEDRQGRLWVTTLGGGFHQVNKQTGKVTRYGIKPTSTVLWNVLTSIYEDRTGFLWISGVGGVARFNPQTKQFTLFSPSQKPEFMTSMAEDAAGRFWICGTTGTYQLDRRTGKFTSVVLDSSLVSQPPGQSLLLDKKGVLWIGTTGEGLFKLDTRQLPGRLSRYNPGGLVNKSIRFNGITEDAQGVLWIVTSKGLQRIDTQLDAVRNFDANPSRHGSLSYQNMSAVYQDRTGTLWLGTENGVNKASAQPKRFGTHQLIPTLPQVVLNKNYISTLIEDHTGTIWLGSTGSDVSGDFQNGLFRMDAKSGQITTFTVNPADPYSLSSNEVLTVYEDRKHRLWVGTQEALHRLDGRTGKFTRYPSQIPVLCVAEDPSGTLWIGGGSSEDGGIGSFDPAKGQFSYYRYNPNDPAGLKNGKVWGIMASRTGDIWVALSGGGIGRLNPRTGKITSYESSPMAAPGQLNDKDVRSLYEDGEGVVWVGTNQGGLHRFDAKTSTFTYFSTRDGLSNNHVVSITGDHRGNLWLGTNQGLSRFNPKTNSFRNYDISDGLPADEFNVGSVYRKKDKLLFGTVNGFVVFHPDSIRDNSLVPPVYLTGLKVLEKSRPIPAGTLELSYEKNFLSFDFVALNYDAPSFVQTFEERKTTLFSTFDRLIDEGFIPCTNGEVSYTKDTIEEYKNSLDKQQFYVSVCGQIKAGKSTFLNYLLFKDRTVLPTAPTPWTAKLTQISFGETDHAIVYFYTTKEWATLKNLVVRDEKGNDVNYFDKYLRDTLNYSASQNVYDREIIQEERLSHTLTDLDKLATYVSSEGVYMPFVSYVEIYVNNPLIRHVVIVDTPGINDPNELRSRITTDFIHKSSAVVYLFAVTMPFDKADLIFIDRYLFAIPSSKIIFTLAQCDQAEDINHLTGYIEKHLRNKAELKERNLLAKDKVYPFSTMAAIVHYKREHQIPLNKEEAWYAARMPPALIEVEGFFEELISGIDQRIMNEKAADVLEDAADKIRTICSLQIKNSLSAIALLEQKVSDLQLSSDQLNAKVERVSEWMREIDEQIESLKKQKSDIMLDIEDKVDGKKFDLIKDALEDYKSWIEPKGVETTLKISGHEIKSIMQSKVRKHIDQKFINDFFKSLTDYQDKAKDSLRKITNEMMPVSRWGHLFEPIIPINKIIGDSLESSNDISERLEKLRETFMLFWTKREATKANLVKEAGKIIEEIIKDFSSQLTGRINKELELFFGELTDQVRKYSIAYSKDLGKLQNNLGDNSINIEDYKKQIGLLKADSDRLQQAYQQIKQTLSVE